jgi:cytochrome c biogenesis factor
MEIAGYKATYRTVTGVKGPDFTGFRSLLTVKGHGESFTVDPGMNVYDAGVGPSNEASIYHDPRTLGDFFATAQIVNTKTHAIDVKLYVKPLINLIWVGGVLFVFGALVAMWPDAVEQRRLAARYAAGAAPAGI